MVWAEVEREATQLLSALIRVDTSQPLGSETQAQRLVEGALRHPAIEVDLLPVTTGRANLLARLRSGSDAPPLLLVSHVDVLATDPASWPDETPPYAGVIRDGAVWGRGALNAKSLVVAHTLALSLLARQKVPLSRDILLAVTADAEGTGELGMASLIRSRPELLRADLALTEGGLSVENLLADGRVVHTVSHAEKGFAELLLTAVGESGPESASAGHRLVQALRKIEERPVRPRITPPVEAMLDAAAHGATFPRDVVFSSVAFSTLFELAELAATPWTAPLVTDGIQLSRLEAGRLGAAQPTRARAVLRCALLPGTSPALIRAEVRAAVRDPEVHVTIVRGRAASESPLNPALLAEIEQVMQEGSERGVVVPHLNPYPTDARHLRQHGVASYGFSPFTVPAHALLTMEGKDEHITVESLAEGVRRMYALLLRLAAKPAPAAGATAPAAAEAEADTSADDAATR